MRLFSRRVARRLPDQVDGARKKPRRRLQIAGISALVALGLVLASTAANGLLEQSEKSSIRPYGERIAVRFNAREACA